jgi:hypothetical protein
MAQQQYIFHLHKQWCEAENMTELSGSFPVGTAILEKYSFHPQKEVALLVLPKGMGVEIGSSARPYS